MLLRVLSPLAVAAAAALTLNAGSATNRFGFAGPEVFPIDFGIAFLHTTDMDGDGLRDLVLVNNGRSKINLLYNRTGKTNAPATPEKVGRRGIGSRHHLSPSGPGHASRDRRGDRRGR